jgi:phage FluMu gp28-like protein
VEDNSRLKICEKSRQIGWTWATAYGLVRRKSLKSARLDAWISSRDEIQARLFLEDCKDFATILQIGAEDLGERAIDTDGNSAYVLRMANQLRIHSMSSNPDAQAGKRGDRVLDEFALHPDPRKLYSIAYPGITWGGSMEIFSTHRGSHNFFNGLIQEARHKGNPKGFSLHRITLQDALDQGFLYKLQSKLPPDDPRQEMDEAAYFDFIKAGCADSETFDQEYMCIPSDDASAFISYALIDGTLYQPQIAWQEIGTGPLYIGVDIGRVHDLTVFWLLEEVAGHFFTRRVIRLQDTPFSEQERIFYELMDMPRVIRACIDNTGIGRQFAERAQQRYRSRVEPVNFTAQSKEALAYPLKAAMEDRTFKMPDDPQTIAAFRSIRKETTAAGNIRFVGERTADGHADEFWAAALALHAAGTAKSPTFVPRVLRAFRSPERRRLTP